jgi:site-specific recombinase XerD
MDLSGFIIWMDEQQAYDTKTINLYKRVTKKFVAWTKKLKSTDDLKQITAGQIRDYRQNLINSSYRPGTINKAIQGIRIFFRWAIEMGYVQANPAMKISYIEEPLIAPKSLTLPQTQALRALLETKSLKTQTIIELGLSAGLRISETISLKVKDITLFEGDQGGEIYVRCGKGFKYRTIPLTLSLAKLIMQYLNVKNKIRSDYLLASERQNDIMTIRWIQKIVINLRKELGFHFTYHSLRHTFCTDLLSAGIKITDVAVMAGHVKKNGMPNITSTARYVLSRPEQLKVGVQQMEMWRQKLETIENP